MTLLCGCVYGNAADNTSTSPAGSAPVVSKGQRVGLVLSGGGAKGVAHIGVIKALEDNDIPIDYVTGTSAGAIVGSLYACGWNPEQMLHLFTQPDFHYWSTGIINPKEISLLTAPEPTPQWVEINLNLRDSTASKNIAGQLIPAHLVSPIPMNIEFLRLYAPYTKQCAENFNNLFVPFRCVCSDVYHKHKIVCHDGSLGDAVRASMSFPLVFKPIEMNGVLVYDGGIYDNFPVDVMREDFNPDFIIG
ncbi:MAG: patatin-like phospholipase family protein, partial [Muribaculaceae bacterium]|nr:patatin-like phospholipase family protein [Muribaculaceae bacterium]